MKRHLALVLVSLGAGACALTGEPPVASTAQDITNAPGVDVSQFQGSINWATVKAQPNQFAFIRASFTDTSGISHADPSFAANWQGAKAAGMIRGAYHYFQGAYDGVAQANFLIGQINAAGGFQIGDLPPVVDVEQNGANNVWDPVTANNVTRVQQWLTTVQNALGVKPYIYTNFSTWQFLGNPHQFSGYPLWVANTEVSSPLLPNGGWSTWTFWQYHVQTGAVGSIPGMPGATGLDHDFYTGSCDNGVAVGGTACASQGDRVQYRCLFGSTPGASLWASESCNGGTCSGAACTSGGVPACGSGLFCAGNQIPGSSACTSGSSTIFCCPSGQTIVNGACTGTPPACGSGLFCALNQIAGSSACMSGSTRVFCCASGHTIVNGACSP